MIRINEKTVILNAKNMFLVVFKLLINMNKMNAKYTSLNHKIEINNDGLDFIPLLLKKKMNIFLELIHSQVCQDSGYMKRQFCFCDIKKPSKYTS